MRTVFGAGMFLAVFIVGLSAALADGSGDPAAVKNEDGKYYDKDGTPTYKVAPDGTVDAAKLGVYKLNNPKKAGESLFTGTAAGKDTGVTRSGALEGSGVDASRAMIDMIASLRAFESGQKVIQTIDETLQKAVTQVGSVTGA